MTTELFKLYYCCKWPFLLKSWFELLRLPWPEFAEAIEWLFFFVDAAISLCVLCAEWTQEFCMAPEETLTLLPFTVEGPFFFKVVGFFFCCCYCCKLPCFCNFDWFSKQIEFWFTVWAPLCKLWNRLLGLFSRPPLQAA